MTNNAETVDYSERELLYNRFMAPALRDALRTMAPASGSHGLDVGCGPGGMLSLFDEQLGVTGMLVGLDISSGHVQAARRIGTSGNIRMKAAVIQADLNAPLPFEDNTFDWAWTADTLTSVPFAGRPDPVAVLREMARVVKPGGTIATFLVSRLGALYLPGYAHIEHCLATAYEVRHRKRDEPRPSFEHENTPAWFQVANLCDIRMTPHIVLHQSPLPDPIHHYIQRYMFEVEYRETPNLKAYALGAGLTEDEWATWLDLSDPASPNYILTRPDYYCVRYGTLTLGRVP